MTIRKGLLLFAVLLLAFLLFKSWTGSEPEPVSETSISSSPASPKSDVVENASPAEPAVPDGVSPSPSGPAEITLKDEAISRAQIANISTPSEVAEIHRQLTELLLVRIEDILEEASKDRVRLSVEEIVERFYLLDRIAKAKGLTVSGAGSLMEVDAPRVERIRVAWQENMALSNTIDELFSERDLLLYHEHLSDLLREWVREAP